MKLSDFDYKVIKTEKVKATQNKYDYINLSWWQNFNDEYLNGYIINLAGGNIKEIHLVNDGYRYVILLGGDEVKNNVLTVRDNVTKEEVIKHTKYKNVDIITFTFTNALVPLRSEGYLYTILIPHGRVLTSSLSVFW